VGVHRNSVAITGPVQPQVEQMDAEQKLSTCSSWPRAAGARRNAKRKRYIALGGMCITETCIRQEGVAGYFIAKACAKEGASVELVSCSYKVSSVSPFEV
jgi:hypothetical protein